MEPRAPLAEMEDIDVKKKKEKPAEVQLIHCYLHRKYFFITTITIYKFLMGGHVARQPLSLTENQNDSFIRYGINYRQ